MTLTLNSNYVVLKNCTQSYLGSTQALKSFTPSNIIRK